MLWKGRFDKQTDEVVNDFNSSLPFDKRMYKEDITGSIAHVNMLGQQGIIPLEESKTIAKGLVQILDDIESGKLVIQGEAEDIHSFVEGELTARLGDLGKKLHTGRSRNDQVATDLRMYLRTEIDFIAGGLLRDLIETLCDLAKDNSDAIMPGYTHLQRAQPITFGHHLMAYATMFTRDFDRLNACFWRMNESPLGSGALAGTTYPIDRILTAEQLGFNRPMINSLDGVSDRDYVIELANCCAMLMMHLSRFSEEIILWTSSEFKFITLDDAFATGSSMMPQKKNPDVAELVRGKTGRVFGSNMALLTVLKGLPLAYNKDMQEDKEAIFDIVDTVKMCLKTFTPMLASIKVEKKNMRNAAAEGFINATDCADYLTKKGIPFREAYQIVGELVGYCVKNDLTLENLPLDIYQASSPVFEMDIYHHISLEVCLNERKSMGGPTKESVLLQIETIQKDIKRIENGHN